jgi:murein DD-endopeptidase MepM/ murein hydrolase activator NlpD
MLDLIPTLLAQHSKQAAPPVQPIETPVQTPAKASTPTSASPIATPELETSQSIGISSTPVTSLKPIVIPQTVQKNSAPVQSASPKVVTSPLALPPVPTQRQIPPQSTEIQSASPETLQPKTTQRIEQSADTTVQKVNQPVEQSFSNAPSVTQDSPQQNSALPSPSTKPEAIRSTPTAIQIPVPTPDLQSTPKPDLQSTPKPDLQPTRKPDLQLTPKPITSTQQQLLEQRLAEIVAKDRAAKQAQQQIQKQDALIARAYNYATQRRFEQARKLLQNSAISAELRSQVLANINSLESSSRAVEPTQANKPTASKPVRSTQSIPAPKPIAVFTGVPSISGRSQQTITIQVPPPLNPAVQRRSVAVRNGSASAIATNNTGAYIDQLGSSDQIVTTPNLQAFNRNLPALTSRDQIVYPLPNPVPVTSKFGWRRHPVTGARRFHAGVDLGAGQGTPVIASRGGRVTAADRMGGYGLAIVMQQSDGTQDTLYAHLSQILVRPGQQIQPGTVIGRVGSTGLSTGPHLHYEARRKTNSGWTPVDPGAQLEAARVRLVRSRQITICLTKFKSGGLDHAISTK